MNHYIRYNDDHSIAELIETKAELGAPYIGLSESNYIAKVAEFDVQINGSIQEQGYNAKVADFRIFRKLQFDAFDIYKTNLNYGVVEETEEEHQEIIDWYREMLSFPETITIHNYMTVVFPTTPLKVAEYL